MVVHGPAILARGVDAVVGLRHVVAHADGLQLSLAGTVRTTLTVQERRSAFEAAMAALQEEGDEEYVDPLRDLRLLVTVDDVSGPAGSWLSETSSQGDTLTMGASFWIDRLPEDRRLILHVSWPSVRLDEVETTLTLDSLDDLTSRVLSLRLP